MSVESLDTSVGARLWYEGTAWTVVELDGATVVLRSADRFKRVHAPSLIGLAQPLDERTQDDDPHAELDAVVLGGLTTAQRARVEAEAQVYNQLVLTVSDTPLEERYQLAGAQLGISARTARRGL